MNARMRILDTQTVSCIHWVGFNANWPCLTRLRVSSVHFFTMLSIEERIFFSAAPGLYNMKHIVAGLGNDKNIKSWLLTRQASPCFKEKRVPGFITTTFMLNEKNQLIFCSLIIEQIRESDTLFSEYFKLSR